MNKVTRADRKKATRLVKAYRKKHELSQGALAEKLECFPGQISFMENGIRVPGTIIRRALELLVEPTDN